MDVGEWVSGFRIIAIGTLNSIKAYHLTLNSKNIKLRHFSILVFVFRCLYDYYLILYEDILYGVVGDNSRSFTKIVQTIATVTYNF